MISSNNYGPLLAVGRARFLTPDAPTTQAPKASWKHTFPNKGGPWILNFLFKGVDNQKRGVSFLFSGRSLDIFRFRPLCGDIRFSNLNGNRLASGTPNAS